MTFLILAVLAMESEAEAYNELTADDLESKVLSLSWKFDKTVFFPVCVLICTRINNPFTLLTNQKEFN